MEAWRRKGFSMALLFEKSILPPCAEKNSTSLGMRIVKIHKNSTPVFKPSVQTKVCFVLFNFFYNTVKYRIKSVEVQNKKIKKIFINRDRSLFSTSTYRYFRSVLWIRIRNGSVFRVCLDPYSEYGPGSTHVNIG